MGIRTETIWCCDRCRIAKTFYENERPGGWTILKILTRPYKPISGSLPLIKDEFVFCEECSEPIKQSIENEINERASMLENA